MAISASIATIAITKALSDSQTLPTRIISFSSSR